MKLTCLLLLAVGAVGAQFVPPPQEDARNTDISVGKSASPPSETLMISASIFEPLLGDSTLSFATDHILRMEPGVRLNKLSNGIALSTHGDSKIEIQVGDQRIALPSPILAHLTELGWEFGNGIVYPGTTVTARRQAQDDTDSNLKAMQESARKIRGKPRDADQQKKKLKLRWLFPENPLAGSEVFNADAIQMLSHMSPIGF